MRELWLKARQSTLIFICAFYTCFFCGCSDHSRLPKSTIVSGTDSLLLLLYDRGAVKVHNTGMLYSRQNKDTRVFRTWQYDLDKSIDLSDLPYSMLSLINGGFCLADNSRVKIDCYNFDGTQIAQIGRGKGRGPGENSIILRYAVQLDGSAIMLDHLSRHLKITDNHNEEAFYDVFRSLSTLPEDLSTLESGVFGYVTDGWMSQPNVHLISKLQDKSWKRSHSFSLFNYGDSNLKHVVPEEDYKITGSFQGLMVGNEIDKYYLATRFHGLLIRFDSDGIKFVRTLITNKMERPMMLRTSEAPPGLPPEMVSPLQKRSYYLDLNILERPWTFNLSIIGNYIVNVQHGEIDPNDKGFFLDFYNKITGDYSHSYIFNPDISVAHRGFALTDSSIFLLTGQGKVNIYNLEFHE
jgi:hypothetical protein